MTERDWAAEVREAMAQAAEPARLRLHEIQTHLDANEREHKTLIQARREVKAMLDKLVPPVREPKPKRKTPMKKTGGNGERASRQEKTQKIRDWLTDHREQYADGFTAAQIHRDMRAVNGKGEIGPGVVLGIVQQLHEAGFVRADRKVRGGAMQYKLVQP